jgi:hypothetical protein
MTRYPSKPGPFPAVIHEANNPTRQLRHVRILGAHGRVQLKAAWALHGNPESAGRDVGIT